MAAFDWQSLLSGLGGGIGMGVGSSRSGGIGNFLFGTDDELKQHPTMNPEQQQLLSQLLSQLGEGGQLGGLNSQALDQLREMLNPSEESFSKFADPYMRQFNEQTVPGIAERFAGAGALSSSGFGQALSSAGSGLQENLAQLKAQLQQKAAGDIMGQYQNMSGLGLSQKPFGYEKIQGSQGLLGAFAQGAGKAAGQYFGSSMGFGG